jgi:SAM-dependent methyltransferase
MKKGIDIYGEALSDYSESNDHSLLMHTSYGETEEMPVWYLFREYDDMPELEKMALAVCEGKTLDVGAGTGVHALLLQQMSKEVMAIDTSEIAVEIMNKSGVKSTKCTNFFDLKDQTYDTILMMMNGIGFIGQLQYFKKFLAKANSLLNPGGQILFDSSDITYLYENSEKPKDKYFGEISFQYEYKGQKGEWFDWVYIDKDQLTELADQAGWFVYFLHQDDNDQYLVRLIKK